MGGDRERLRTAFDSAADRYRLARPEYPEKLYDVLINITGLGAGDELLEIGCATGKATIPLARRGFRITAIEIGTELAATARRNLASFPDVTVLENNFEAWRPPPGHHFSLVFAATAWHWIDPAVRYQRAWESLEPGGWLAFWTASHVFPDDGDPFFAEIQDVYDDIGEGLPDSTIRPRPGELADSREEVERSGLFTDTVVRQFDWEVRYTAEQYIQLLNTFSGHIAMATTKRDYLYSEIRRRLVRRSDRRVRRHWGAALHVTRRAGAEI